MIKSENIGRVLLFLMIIALSCASVYSQKIGVFNEKHKKIYTIKAGRDLDFRIDYNKLYPERNDSIVESRVFALIDSIKGDKIYLSESFVIANYTKDKDIIIEREYEYTELIINIDDIKSASFTPIMASIGKALLTIGIATMVVSPLLGISSGGYRTERVVTVASIGAGTAIIGGAFAFSFGQKPVKFKDFEGPEYFKKYQKGSLSTL